MQHTNPEKEQTAILAILTEEARKNGWAVAMDSLNELASN